MAIINRYKLRDGTTIEDVEAEVIRRRTEKIKPHMLFCKGGTWINDRAVHFISCWCGDEDISLNIGFPEDLSTWDDFDDVLVLDEDVGQAYYPFYDADENEKERFPFVLNIIGTYNRIMDSFEFLERKQC